MSQPIIETPPGFAPRFRFRPNAPEQIGLVLIALDTLSLIGAAFLAHTSAAHLAERIVDPARLAAIAAFPAAFALPLLALRGAYRPDAALKPSRVVSTLLLIWMGLLPLAGLLTVGLQIRLDIAHDGLTYFALAGPAILLLQRYAFAGLLRQAPETIPIQPRQGLAETEGAADGATLDGTAVAIRSQAAVGLTAEEALPARLPARRRVQRSGDGAARALGKPGERRAQPAILRRSTRPDRLVAETGRAVARLERHWIRTEADRRAVKRGFDVAAAALLCVLLAPLLVFIAVLIRLTSDGPVLFRQMRGGLNGRPFEIYKFRTMTVQPAAATVLQAQRHDPRVTPLGRILRRSSLDELPQLFNVLKGEMSLVGPRPHAISHDDDFALRVTQYPLRYRVKPGITGWAQVCGYRGETRTDEALLRRVELDLDYIERWSLWFDLRIIARTCREVIASRAAY